MDEEGSKKKREKEIELIRVDGRTPSRTGGFRLQPTTAILFEPAARRVLAHLSCVEFRPR
jgi:hypothetical protein